MTAPRWRAAGVGLAALFAVAVVRVDREARWELREGRAALARNEVERGVGHLRRAAHLRLPWGGPSREGFEALESFARESEVRGQSDRALLAWRAVRASARGTRWLATPERERLARADRRIASLMARLPPAPEDRDVPASRREEQLLAGLVERADADPAWRLVAAVGLAMSLFAASRLASQGWDDAAMPRRDVVVRSVAALLVGAALFAVALARA